VIELPVAPSVQRYQVGRVVNLSQGGGVWEAGYLADVTDVDVEAVAAGGALSRALIRRARQSSHLCVESKGSELGPEFADGSVRELETATGPAEIAAIRLRVTTGGAHGATGGTLSKLSDLSGTMLRCAPPRAESGALFSTIGFPGKGTPALFADCADDFATPLGEAKARP
jgi:hypothetical protein